MNKQGFKFNKVKESSIDKLKKYIEIDEIKNNIDRISKYGKVND